MAGVAARMRASSPASPDTTGQPGPAAADATGRGNVAELGLAALLLAVGALVLSDASQLTTTAAHVGPVGPKAVPYAVGGLLLVTAVLLAVDVLRGGHGEAETGEDVDLEHGVDWRGLGLLVLVFLATALAIPYAGFPVAGAALFWGTSVVLGSRRWLWDPVIAVAVAVGSYLVFTSSLGISLPAGVLEAVL
jgi:putative tricarboxylic transport membrane protein